MAKLNYSRPSYRGTGYQHGCWDPRKESRYSIKGKKKKHFTEEQTAKYPHKRSQVLDSIFAALINFTKGRTRVLIYSIDSFYKENGGITEDQFSAIKKIYRQSIKKQKLLIRYESYIRSNWTTAG